MDDFEIVEGSSPIWVPKNFGDTIMGKVTKVLQGTYGIQLEIETQDGAKYRTPSHKALQSRLDKLKVGDVVKIVYEKEIPPAVRGQNPTKIYSVYKKK